MTDANLNRSSPNVFIPILKPLPVTALRTTPNVTPVLDSQGAEASALFRRPEPRRFFYFILHAVGSSAPACREAGRVTRRISLIRKR